MSKLTKAANGQYCVRCYANDETVVSCHYSGLRQLDYGKGKGRKGNDLIAADLCKRCHDYFDLYETPNDWVRSEEFLHYCVLTILRRWDQGVIK